MTQQVQVEEPSRAAPKRRSPAREVRPLTTDERASFIIVSLYLTTLCVATFLYWDSLMLMILGATAASAGIFLFFAAFFNTEAPEKSHSIHPIRSYLISFFFVLLTLFLLRFFGGLIPNTFISVALTYIGLFIALVVFRKAMVQVISALLALTFLFVTFLNLDDVLSRRMRFRDTLEQCGHAIFQIGPIQDVANMLLAGPYVTYLNRLTYRNKEINLLATRKVALSNDDDLLKTTILLNFVSNDIHYISDPDDGLEFAKDPLDTLIAGGGDCEDQALLLASMLESVGVKTYMAFTPEHVFILVCFTKAYPDLQAQPYGYIDNQPCYALDPSDPNAEIGFSTAKPQDIERVFDSRERKLAHLYPLDRE